MVVWPSRKGGLEADVLGGARAGPPCLRCGEPRKSPQARFCAQCGLRLAPPSSSEINGFAGAYAEAIVRGRQLRELGWTRLALRSFRKAMAIRPDSVDPLLEIARTYLDARRFWQARRWYGRVLRRQPDCFEAWRRGAQCFGWRAHLRRARWLIRAYTLQPGDMGVLNELTCHLAQLSRWRQWRVHQKLWSVYEATSPDVLPPQGPSRAFWRWLLPPGLISPEWEKVLAEWARNKRAGRTPYTRGAFVSRLNPLGGTQPS